MVHYKKHERTTMYIANRRDSSKFNGCSPLQLLFGLIGLKPQSPTCHILTVVSGNGRTTLTNLGESNNKFYLRADKVTLIISSKTFFSVPDLDATRRPVIVLKINRANDRAE